MKAEAGNQLTAFRGESAPHWQGRAIHGPGCSRHPLTVSWGDSSNSAGGTWPGQFLCPLLPYSLNMSLSITDTIARSNQPRRGNTARVLGWRLVAVDPDEYVLDISAPALTHRQHQLACRARAE